MQHFFLGSISKHCHFPVKHFTVGVAVLVRGGVRGSRLSLQEAMSVPQEVRMNTTLSLGGERCLRYFSSELRTFFLFIYLFTQVDSSFIRQGK